MRFSARFKTGVVAVLALGVVGCAADSQGQELKLPPKNLEAWVMPLDEFVFTSSPLRDYAEALLEQECYAEKGVEWDVPWQPMDRGFGPAFSNSGQRLFNVELAQQYGYHKAPNDWENKEAWTEFVESRPAIAESTPGFDAIFRECGDFSRGRLPLPSDEDRNYAADATSQSLQDALLEPKLEDHASAWADCMLEAGYRDLPANPELMPPDEFAGQWAIDDPFSVAGQDEISMATADAQCSKSTGWDQALYDMQWDKQEQFVLGNADRLVRIREAIKSEREMLETAVAENAPRK